MGLANLLLGITDFEELMELSKKGQNGKVDMLVKDLSGGASAASGLKGDIISSSFGKLATGVGVKYKESLSFFPSGIEINEASDYRYYYITLIINVSREDIAKSLVSMVAANIAHLSYLVARINKVSR